MNLWGRVSKAATHLLQSDGESYLAIVKSLAYNGPGEKTSKSSTPKLNSGPLGWTEYSLEAAGPSPKKGYWDAL